jgi:hypothetical protein
MKFTLFNSLGSYNCAYDLMFFVISQNLIKFVKVTVLSKLSKFHIIKIY